MPPMIIYPKTKYNIQTGAKPLTAAIGPQQKNAKPLERGAKGPVRLWRPFAPRPQGFAGEERRTY